MKKLIISLCLLSFLLSPFSVSAQTLTQEQLTQQLIVILTQMIAQLQQQINDILAQQSLPIYNPLTISCKRDCETSNCSFLKSYTICAAYPLGCHTDSGYLLKERVGNKVSFIANASGGNGIYSYYWSSPYGFNGSCDSQSCTTSFSEEGQNTLSLTVKSGDGQVVHKDCGVNIVSGF